MGWSFRTRGTRTWNPPPRSTNSLTLSADAKSKRAGQVSLEIRLKELAVPAVAQKEVYIDAVGGDRDEPWILLAVGFVEVECAKSVPECVRN